MITLTARISKAIAGILRSHQDFWEKFNRIIIYYDNGQIELTKILTSVFNSLYANIEFRKVKPVDYKLFQAADLICTMNSLLKKRILIRFQSQSRNSLVQFVILERII